MDGNKTGMPLFFMLFLFVKLSLGNLSDEQSTHTQESTVWKHGKVKTGQKEEHLRSEATAYNSFVDSLLHETKRKSKKVVPRIPYFHKRKTVPGKVIPEIARVLAKHIEGMEPQFKSASFQQLWQELREPLTNVMKPRKIEELLTELDQCNLGDAQHTYEFPTDVESIKRDLVICKIGEILEVNGEESSQNQGNYAHIWSLLKNPLTSCFKVTELSSLIKDLRKCLPRFELAGIKYIVPSKMSEVARDVVICKVDDVFNKSLSERGSGSGNIP